MSLFLIPGVDDKNVESSILTLARSVDRVANEFNLTKMSHTADLSWVVGELKGILASWGETEILNAATKDRVQHLVQALDEMIKEER
jgi:hypothetical protein